LVAVLAEAEAANCSGLAAVVVNEFSTDTDAEWIELHNNSGAAVSLDGWEVEYATRAWAEATSETLPADASVAAGGYFVVGVQGSGVSLDYDAGTMDLGNASTGADGIRLRCSGSTGDAVLYAKSGKTNTDGLEDNASGDSLAPYHGDGETTGRYPDGVDTDTSAVDFDTMGPTPGTANAEPRGEDTGDTGFSGGPADCAGGASVKINEFDIQTDAEWVELFNAGADPVAIGGWALEYSTNDNLAWKEEFLAEGVIEAGGYYVLGNLGAGVRDQDVIFDPGNGGSSADGLRISCDGDVLDTVIYGKAGENDGQFTEDDGTLAETWASAPKEGHSTARKQNGVDSDRSFADFTDSDSPTPGDPNPEVVCAPGNGDIKLNEVFYDPEGADGGNDWVEIFNAGDQPARLDGWMVQTASSSWDDPSKVVTFGAETELAAGSFLLVAGEDVLGAEVNVSGFTIGNGSDGDGIRIVDCEGTPMDGVLYGEELGSDSTLVDDAGGTAVVATVSSGLSIGRSPDGEDSDSIDDWFAFSAPTPGAANGEPGVGGATPVGKGCGCGRDPADPTAPDDGCSVAPRVRAAGWLLAAAVVWFRRRS
jgi:hypothetical protein